VPGLGDDLGGNTVVEAGVVAVVAQDQDFGVYDVEDLGGDYEAGLEGAEDGQLERDAQVVVWGMAMIIGAWRPP
jgi:hypothetical protein